MKAVRNYSFEEIRNKREFVIIDYLKLFLACLVVYMHTSPLHSIQPHLNYVIVNAFGRIAVPFFFVCSGFFLFRKRNLTPLIIFNYLKRLFILYLIWTIVYALFEHLFSDEDFSVNKVLHMLVYNSTSVWYVEALLLSVIVLYTMSRFMKWNHLLIIFFTITFLIYTPINYYLQKPLGLSVFYQELEGLNFLRISSIFFVCLGGFFGNVDLSKIYKGKFLKHLLIFFLLTLISESVIFKQLAISHGEKSKLPQYYFSTGPFVFLLFYYCIVSNMSKLTWSPTKCRKYSSIIYFSHHCFKVLFLFLAAGFADTVFGELVKFAVVLLSAFGFAFFLVRIEGTRIGRLTQYLY